MKKLSPIFTVFLIAISIPITVFAHPGNTDGRGGHYDHSTGEYHYHHGYSAHDHYDMDGDGKDDCPYNFVDKTDTSNNGSSGSVKITPFSTDLPTLFIDFTVPEFEVPTFPTIPSVSVNNASHQLSASTTNRETSDNESISLSTLFIFVIPLGIAAFINYFRWKGAEAELSFRTDGSKAVLEKYLDLEKKNKKLQDEVENLRKENIRISNSEATWKNQASEARIKSAGLVKLREAEIDTLRKKIELLQNEKKMLIQKYPYAKTESLTTHIPDPIETPDNVSVSNEHKEFCNIKLERAHINRAPLDVYFAEDGYPVYWHPNQSKPYGDFTVYYNSKSKIYHTDRFCASYNSSKTHIFKVIESARPCRKCAEGYFDFNTVPDWFASCTTDAKQDTRVYPHPEVVSQEYVENIALELGIPIDIAVRIINYERKDAGLPSVIIIDDDEE